MKHARIPGNVIAVSIGVVLAFAVALLPPEAKRASAQTPPAPPPAPNATASSLNSPPAGTPLPSEAPIPSSSPTSAATPTAAPGRRGRRGHGPNPEASANPEPSATPTSPAFATLDGTWEVQLQYLDRTEYSYLVIKQSGTSELSGLWRVKGKEYPFQGTYDGRLIRMAVTEPTGNVTLSGYVEGASDMVGLLDTGVSKTDVTAFTAEHRGSKGSTSKDDAPRRGRY